MPFTYSDIRPLKMRMEEQYKYIINTEDDWVQIITGDTGSGKSLLTLDLFDEWNKKYFSNDSDKHKTFLGFSTTDEKFVMALGIFKREPGRRIVHDEAISLLYRKNAITKKNKATNMLFKQIRGLQFYFDLVAPQIHRIDKEFVEDRVKSLIYVEKRKNKRIAHYFTQPRAHKLINELEQMNKNRADKDMVTHIKYCKTEPLFSCEIKEYNGRFRELYKPKKRENMENAILEAQAVVLGKSVMGEQEKMSKALEIKKLISKGWKKKDICRKLKISFPTMQTYSKMLIDEDEMIL